MSQPLNIYEINSLGWIWKLMYDPKVWVENISFDDGAFVPEYLKPIAAQEKAEEDKRAQEKAELDAVRKAEAAKSKQTAFSPLHVDYNHGQNCWDDRPFLQSSMLRYGVIRPVRRPNFVQGEGAALYLPPTWLVVSENDQLNL